MQTVNSERRLTWSLLSGHPGLPLLLPVASYRTGEQENAPRIGFFFLCRMRVFVIAAFFFSGVISNTHMYTNKMF